MRRFLILVVLLVITSTPGFTQTFKPASFYLKNPSIPENAKNYYLGKFKASDDLRTESIIDSLSTANNTTRPFYIYLVCKMLHKADGALSEALGQSCKTFTESNPDDLIEFLKTNEISSKTTFFSHWANAMAGEFMIDCEGHELKCVRESLTTTSQNCKPSNRPMLTKLYAAVKHAIPAPKKQ